LDRIDSIGTKTWISMAFAVCSGSSRSRWRGTFEDGELSEAATIVSLTAYPLVHSRVGYGSPLSAKGCDVLGAMAG
jgi:hypothetical protein